MLAGFFCQFYKDVIKCLNFFIVPTCLVSLFVLESRGLRKPDS